jgi:hypothetical protein
MVNVYGSSEFVSLNFSKTYQSLRISKLLFISNSDRWLVKGQEYMSVLPADWDY